MRISPTNLSKKFQFYYNIAFVKHFPSVILNCIFQNGAIVSSISLGGSVLATPLLRGPFVFVGTLDGGCVSVEAETLKTVWQTTLKSPIFSSPCLLDDGFHILLAEVEGWIHCFDTKTGNKVCFESRN